MSKGNFLKTKLFIISIFFSVLGGCSSTNYMNYGKITNEVKSGILTHASYIQWNEEYAVTAAHVKGINADFTCSSGCDLVFFKNKDIAFDNSTKWRDIKAGEKIIAVGNTVNNNTVARKGVVLNLKVVDTESVNYYYFVNTANTVGGMSGGPVYAENDKYLVGMTLGMTIGSPDVNNPNIKPGSLFIPYEIIMKEWKKFQNI